MRIRVVDSHTGGEPTRTVVGGFPALSGETMSKRLQCFREEFDPLRSGLVCEPRGSEVLVGALLTEPVEAGSIAGVVFFNTLGYLGMCGHGSIGVVETLRHMGRLSPGDVRLDTPVGTIGATLHEDGRVSISNVKSYRHRADVSVEVPGLGKVRGDVAYGGNWFFIVKEPHFEISMARVRELTALTLAIRDTLDREGITGEGGAWIDHVEVFGEPSAPGAQSRNFVMCPGGAYDRSPCGTGTSAKLACLAADGLLAPGEPYEQESTTGSVFVGSYQPAAGGIVPTITGRAFVTGESELIFSDDDPLRWGIR